MAMVTVTNRQVRIMWEIFGRMSGKNMHRKAAFAVAKNKSKIEHIIKALDEARTAPEDYLAFEKKRFEIVKEFASKDKDGNPKIVRGVEYQILPKKRAEFDEKVEALRAEYEDAIAKATEVEKQYKEILDEEVEINLHFIDEDYLPEEITPAEIEGIGAFIRWSDTDADDEDTPEPKKKLKAVE